MKKYIKPELEVSLIKLNNNVASNAISTNFTQNNIYTETNDVGTLSWDELF